MGVKNLTSKNFDEFIKTDFSIIDFYADWCMPCKITSPIIEEISSKFKNINFGKVNVDKESELTRRFIVMSIPTLVFFKGKEQAERRTGAFSKEELIEKINKLMKNK